MPAERRPNILLIMADDMGYSDLGCYGSEIPTPHIDGLAQDGVRFSMGYSCAKCCPTRASLLTGLYPHQAGVGAMVHDFGLPGYRGFLQEDSVTLAEVLRAEGYRTYLSGKWHVGGHYWKQFPETWTPGAAGFPTPLQRGFDRYYGTLAGSASYFNPPTLTRDDMLIKPEDESYYYTDAITDNAISMMDDAARRENPFFLYVAYTAPHWPLHAPEDDIARFQGQYRNGWEVIREDRHDRLREMGVLDPKWQLSPRDAGVPPWADAPHKAWQDRRMATYAAQIHCMDQGIGRVLQRLRSLGLEDDTLIVFLSDNGGTAEELAEDWNADKVNANNLPTLSGRPVHIGNTPELMPGPEQTFMSYGRPWANVSNTPFRFFKKWAHEGGIAVPLVVRMPGRFKAGSICHAPVHVVDLNATLIDVAGARYPKEFNGHAIKPHEGHSFVPALEGKPWDRGEALCFEHYGNRALRAGRWKLTAEHRGPWELYDMVEDRTELHDLADTLPDQVRALAAQYADWAGRTNIMDYDEVCAIVRQRGCGQPPSRTR